jgi:hypothetical protein
MFLPSVKTSASDSRRPLPTPRNGRGVLLLGLAMLAGGCVIFPGSLNSLPFEASKKALPPLKAKQDAIQIEVMFVDRDADDPVITHELWRQVDQLGTLPAKERQTLFASGFAVGQVGASPPPVIQTLVGLSEQPVEAPIAETKPLMARRLVMPSGAETEIQVSELLEVCEYQEPDVEDSDKSEQPTKRYQQARLVLKLKANRLQEGWVQLEVTPEVHHGDLKMRHVPTPDGWEFRNTQKVERQAPLKFILSLNLGELAVVTSAPKSQDTLGTRFFRTTIEDHTRQRVVLIRLADLKRVDGVRIE